MVVCLMVCLKSNNIAKRAAVGFRHVHSSGRGRSTGGAIDCQTKTYVSPTEDLWKQSHSSIPEQVFHLSMASRVHKVTTTFFNFYYFVLFLILLIGFVFPTMNFMHRTLHVPGRWFDYLCSFTRAGVSACCSSSMATLTHVATY